MAEPCPSESFSALSVLPGLRHAFLLRTPGLDVDTLDKAEALNRLQPHHDTALKSLGLHETPLVLGTQVHGNQIHLITSLEEAAELDQPIPDVDGFVTAVEGVLLGVYVADCCAVFLADPVRRAIGLVHSGKKGTELGITTEAIQRMNELYGSVPADLIVQLSPCIRPPAYEVDFAAAIREQARMSGVPSDQIHDPGTCTSTDLERYYSYRQERGQTGRMLALLGWSS